MNTKVNINKKDDKQYRFWMTVLRIIFGFLLIVKGIYFIQHTTLIFSAEDLVSVIALIFAILHIFIGILICVGLATRALSLTIIPVIIASVFFSNPQLKIPVQLFLTIVTLLFAVFFVVEGSGRFSVYYYFTKMKEPEDMTTAKDDTKDI